MADNVIFADLLEHIVDNRGRTCPTANAGRPLIATNCVRNNLLYPSYETDRYVDEPTYRDWFRGHPVAGDLLFVTKGTPGRVCFVPDPFDFCIAQDMVAIRANPSKIYPRFLFALLRSKAVQEQIEQLHVGSLIPHFKKGDFDKLHLSLPDRKTQEFVGDLYFRFSEKIELNRRMNETLEGMARAIFKSWFVDFDPVRAKADGRQPAGMDSATAALFPDSFEDSPLGKIPKGWNIAKLGDLIELKRGHDLPQRERRAGNVPIYSSAGLTGYHVCGKASGPGVVTGRYGTIGQVFYVEADYWPLNTTLYVCDFKGSAPRFVAYLLQTIEFQSFVDKAAVPGINRNHIHQAKVVAPPVSVQNRFAELWAPHWERQRVNGAETVTLSTLRDALLPKLLSGEIRVPEAEWHIEAAT